MVAVRDLERRTLAEQVYQSLRTAILNDEFLPGAELQETALAERYGVSRGPVREALRLLRADGLVTIVSRMGARVRSLNRQDFRGVYQVRAVLEELAVRLAVPRLSSDEMDELGGYLEKIKHASQDDDASGVFEANTAFHLMFITHSGNVALQAAYSQVRDLISRYQRRSLALRGGMSTLGDEHRVIYEAAVNRDADEAARCMKQHILLPTARVDDLSEDALTELSEVLGTDVQL